MPLSNRKQDIKKDNNSFIVFYALLILSNVELRGVPLTDAKRSPKA